MLSDSKLRYLTLVAFAIVTFISLAFTGILHISSFQKNYTISLISGYRLSGAEIVRKIEYAVRYGKPLENFHGIEALLNEVREDFPNVREVQVISTQQEILFNQDGPVTGQFVAEELHALAAFSPGGEGENFQYMRAEDSYNVLLPIRDRDEAWIGTLNLVFPQEVISSRTDYYSMLLLRYLVMLALTGMLILILINRFVSFTTAAKPVSVSKDHNIQLEPLPSFTADGLQINKKVFMTVLLLLLGLMQLAYGWISYSVFKEAYLENSRNNAILVSGIVQKDIESVVQKGVSYHELYRLEDYLGRIVGSIPEVENIYLSGEQHGSSGEEPFLNIALAADGEQNRMQLRVDLSHSYLNSRMRTLLLDTATMVVVSIVLMFEVIIFMLILLQRQLSRIARYRDTDKFPSGLGSVDVTIVRPLVFIIAMAVFMASSFIPLMMRELYQPLLGLSESVILGLPISAEMLFAGVAAVLAGSLIDRRGWQPIFYLGIVIFAAGLFLSSQAMSPLFFIMARGIAGVGYGFLLMALRGFINTRPLETERTEGFSAFISGLYAGFIGGVVVGAMLADRIGYGQVFLVALIFCLLAGLFILLFLRGSSSTIYTPVQPSSLARGSVRSFLSNVPVVSLFLFIVLPLTICSMFVDYYLPVFAAGQGISTSNVGRAFMLNGIAIVYLGPFLSTYTDKRLGAQKSILLSGLITVGAILIFVLSGTFTAAFLVVILLGVSESFGLVAQNNYFVNLKATGVLGTGAALGYFDNVRKLGQMLGPLVFGVVIAFGYTGIGIVGIITLGALFLFMLTARRKVAV